MASAEKRLDGLRKQTKERRLRFGVGARLALTLAFVTLLSALAVGGGLHFANLDRVRSLQGVEAATVGRSAALMIEHQLFLESINPVSPDAPAARAELVERLHSVKSRNNLASEVVTIAEAPDGTLIYGVTTHSNPFLFHTFTSDRRIPHIREVLTDGIEVTSEPYTDERGTWISSYAPILDNRQRPVGVVMIDRRIDQFATGTLESRSLWIVAFLGALLSLVLGWLLSMRFSVPLRRLAQAAEDIANDKKTRIPIIKRRDEFGRLSRSFRVMFRNLKRRNTEITRITLGLVSALEQASGENDPDTGFHIRRVSAYSKMLAEKAGLSEDLITRIERYAPLHDVGKVSIPDRILKKEGKLTDHEYTEMKHHVVAGGSILEAAGVDRIAVNICKFHHEKWDGTGYSEGLKADSIPIEARIVAIADVYDALTSIRCYKAAFSPEKAKSIMLEDSGTHFDPRLLKHFFECEKEIRHIRQTLNPSEPPPSNLELVFVEGKAL